MNSALRACKKYAIPILLAAACIAFAAYYYYQAKSKSEAMKRYTLGAEALRIVNEHLGTYHKEIEVLDINIQDPSTNKVNYVYDRLYLAIITFKSDGNVKKMFLDYGYYKGQWIGPDNTTIYLATKNALVISQ